MLSSEIEAVTFTKGPKSVYADEVRAAEPGKSYRLVVGKGKSPAQVRATLSYAARQCGIKIMTKIEGRSVIWGVVSDTVVPVGDPPAVVPVQGTPLPAPGTTPKRKRSPK